MGARSRVLNALEKECDELAHGVMLVPPADYAKFMFVVGEYRAKQSAIQLIKETGNQDDDDL